MPHKYTIDHRIHPAEIDIPDGWQVVESGDFQDKDKFLIGGRHNAWLIGANFVDIFDSMIGTPINNYEHLVIRQTELA